MQYNQFSKRQHLALTWWKDSRFSDCDGIICDGAVRSGKTVAMAVGFVLWSMSRFRNQRFALCGKTIESLRRNVSTNIPAWLEGVADVKEHRSENKLVISIDGRSNTYYLFGGKDESSYTLIQGITLAGVLFDEVALMPRSFVEQAMARCSVAGSKLWFNCNPEAQMHWFNQEWILKAHERNMIHLHFTMSDNLSLSDDIRARYERMYSGVFYDRYIRGLWVAAEGLIYDMFDRKRHVTATRPECEGDYYVSCDYGTQNPTCFLLWRRIRGASAWFCEDEYYYSGRTERRQRTDGEFADDMQQFIRGRSVRQVVVDPSAASFIAELRQRGLPVQKADNDVLNGIRLVGEKLKAGELLFASQCVNIISEFGAYVWDEKAAMRGEDRPVKDHDHAMDAMRYFVSTVLNRGMVRVGRRPRGF